ncbi:c-type cytochrome [Rhodopirellula sp. MGV]|uniref:c-type cytochrome n=1 Tax=Rhodopirellula sp. MGV TaxID=2023130 RepID=UPI000B97C4B9|nr:c-type cytochrome [Rhodopirellula sp. MGV]OYP28273.1 cytochrome C [Rhodopirellula sp. MGV]PNY38849.1 cytochrome C [Rhodopirellula baltica]
MIERRSSRRRTFPLAFFFAVGLAGSNLLAGETALESSPQTHADLVELGESIVAQTSEHPLSKRYVGNRLNCTSCHLENGRHSEAASFIGIATAYPAWSPREKRVITLQDRVLNCFMRSENGTRPPQGSLVSIAITTYITSLSEGLPIKMNPNRPLGPNAVKPLPNTIGKADPARGKQLYEIHCASCHGDDGLGNDDEPPVWGDQSYNDGAGMSRNEKLAAWLKVAMPLDDAILTDQESADIAAYVNEHSRPRFELSSHLPPPDQSGIYNGVQPD